MSKVLAEAGSAYFYTFSAWNVGISPYENQQGSKRGGTGIREQPKMAVFSFLTLEKRQHEYPRFLECFYLCCSNKLQDSR